jgi:uncharacterized membrane protein
MRSASLAYIAALLTLGAADALWLGWLMPAQYQAWIGHLMRPEPLWPSALAFYLLYPVGIAVLGVQPSARAVEAAGRGALLGLIAYGTYDLTNHATLQGWPLALTLVDMAWGATVSALAAGAGYGLARRFGR